MAEHSETLVTNFEVNDDPETSRDLNYTSDSAVTRPNLSCNEGHNKIREKIRVQIFHEMASLNSLALPGAPDDPHFHSKTQQIALYSPTITRDLIHTIVSDELSSFLSAVRKNKSATPPEKVEDFTGEERKGSVTTNETQPVFRKLSATPEVKPKMKKSVPNCRQSFSSQASYAPRQFKLQNTVAVSCPWLFGGFTHNSPVRIKCFQIHHSVHWSTFFGTVSTACALYISIAPELALSYIDQRADPSAIRNPLGLSDVFEFFCAVCLFSEVLIGSIAVGFISDSSTWLRCNNFHKLDLLVLLTTAAEYITFLFGTRSASLRASRLFRVFRPMSAMNYFLDLRLVLISLREGLFQILTVLLIMVLFITSLSVFGLAMYKTTYRRQCIWKTALVPNCASDFTTGWGATCKFATDVDSFSVTPSLVVGVAGGYPFIDYCKIYVNSTPRQYEKDYPYDSDGGYYHSCQLRDFRAGLPVAQTCQDFGPGATVFQYGFTNFDDIWGSMMAIFQARKLMHK